MKKRRHQQGGFTLLELLMVVIIIAILASIALPQYLRVVKKSTRGEAMPVMSTLRSAEMRYQAEHNAFTGTLTELDIDYAGGVASSTNWDFTVDPAVPQVVATGKVSAATCVLNMDVNTGVVTGTPDETGAGC